jgi:hypothetical protein
MTGRQFSKAVEPAAFIPLERALHGPAETNDRCRLRASMRTCARTAANSGQVPQMFVSV